MVVPHPLTMANTVGLSNESRLVGRQTGWMARESLSGFVQDAWSTRRRAMSFACVLWS